MIAFMNLVLFAMVSTCMRVISDYFLVAKGVLVFPDSDNVKLFKTPVKMFYLRMIALLSLGIFYCYYEQLRAVYDIPFAAYIFPASVFMLYAIVEFVANNYFSGNLWKEDNCNKVWGIGSYALSAELLATLALHLAFIMMYLLEPTLHYVLNAAIVTGIVIFLSFVLSYEAFGKN